MIWLIALAAIGAFGYAIWSWRRRWRERERASEERWKLVCFEKDAPKVVGLWEAELPADSVLVFGNEDDGIADVVLEAAHEVVAIPMYGINHSYPIAISAGIGLCEWARRRYAAGRLVVPEQKST